MACFLIGFQANTQPPFSTSVYGPAPQNLIHNCIAKTVRPGLDFYAVASTIENSGNYNILISYIDMSGNVIWSEEIDVGADDRALDVIIDQNDNIVVTGYVGDPNNHELYVVMFDPTGTFINDFQLQVPNTAGTIITESVIYGGFYIGGYERGPIQQFNMTSKGILIHLDLSLNVVSWGTNFFQSSVNNTISDVVELNNGNVFITGSMGHAAPGQVVLAAIIDPLTGNVIPGGNMSFAPGNDHSLGASLAYDPLSDEVWLLFNSELDSKPYVIGFSDVTTSSFSINPSGFSIIIPDSGPDMHAGFTMLLSPHFDDGLTIFGYKDFTTFHGTGFALWALDVDRYTGASNSNVKVWKSAGTPPAISIEYQGGVLLSLFSPLRSSPYFHTPTIAVESVWGNRFVALNLDESILGFTEYNPLSFAHNLNTVSSNCMDEIQSSIGNFTPNPELLLESILLTPSITPLYPHTGFPYTNPGYCAIFNITSRSSSNSISVKEESIVELKSSIEVYPNPTNNLVNIKLNGTSNIKEVMVMNSVGQVVYSKSPESTSNIQVDLSQLSNGIYIVRVIDTDNSVLTERVIKQ